MIKQINLIALVAVGIGVRFLGTNLEPTSHTAQNACFPKYKPTMSILGDQLSHNSGHMIQNSYFST